MTASRIIGVISPYLEKEYASVVFNGIQASMHEHGYQVMIINGTPRDVFRYSLGWEQVAGWIVLIYTEGIEELAESGLPMVTIAAEAQELACPSVLTDNRGGLQAAVRHMIEHGHQQIAFVGFLGSNDVRERYDGYRAALAEAGIELDEALSIFVDDDLESGGRQAARRLIDAGMPCTALVLGTDENALGAMEILTLEGYRIPEDIALISFDDIERAQTAEPPLSTVRQQPHHLGRIAGELLLAQIAGEQVPARPSYVHTALMTRQTCGCQPHRQAALQPDTMEGGSWQQALMRQMVRQAAFPIEPMAHQRLTDIWPGIDSLVATLEAQLAGQPLPDAREREHAWQHAFLLTAELRTLLELIGQLEQAGLSQIQTSDRAARNRMGRLIDQLRQEMLQSYMGRQTMRINFLETLVETNYRISMGLLGAEGGSAVALEWLSQTAMDWGCLGMWQDQISTNPPQLSIAGSYSRDGNLRLAVGGSFPSPQFPPSQLLELSALTSHEQVVLVVPVQTTSREWGLLALHGPIGTHVSFENVGMWATLLGAALEHDMLLESLARQQKVLQTAYERERSLGNIVRELGCPIIPLLPGVLLIPLVGSINTERADQVLEMALEGVSSYKAKTVLLDITGVPLVDTQTANSLIHMARAVTLLGAMIILVGVRPEIAQSIVGLGIDLKHIATQPTLEAALEMLQRRDIQRRDVERSSPNLTLRKP